MYNRTHYNRQSYNRKSRSEFEWTGTATAASRASGTRVVARRHAGLTVLLKFAGMATGIDADVGYATEESRDGVSLPPKAALLRDRIISQARF